MSPPALEVSLGNAPAVTTSCAVMPGASGDLVARSSRGVVAVGHGLSVVPSWATPGLLDATARGGVCTVKPR